MFWCTIDSILLQVNSWSLGEKKRLKYIFSLIHQSLAHEASSQRFSNMTRSSCGNEILMLLGWQPLRGMDICFSFFYTCIQQMERLLWIKDFNIIDLILKYWLKQLKFTSHTRDGIIVKNPTKMKQLNQIN